MLFLEVIVSMGFWPRNLFKESNAMFRDFLDFQTNWKPEKRRPIGRGTHLSALSLHPLADHALLVLVHESVALCGRSRKVGRRGGGGGGGGRCHGRPVDPSLSLIAHQVTHFGHAGLVDAGPVDPLLVALAAFAPVGGFSSGRLGFGGFALHLRRPGGGRGFGRRRLHFGDAGFEGGPVLGIGRFLPHGRLGAFRRRRVMVRLLLGRGSAEDFAHGTPVVAGIEAGQVDGRVLAVGGVVDGPDVDDRVARLLAAGRIRRGRAVVLAGGSGTRQSQAGRLLAAARARSARSRRSGELLEGKRNNYFPCLAI